jgi:hypothetical protein
MPESITRLAIAFLCAMPPCGADSWPGPQPANVFSSNGDYFVRIIPGESLGDTVGFAGAGKGRFARGEFYARQSDRSYKLIADVELQNPVAPVDSLVSNQGYLLTFDNWHNAGYGKVVAIYRPNGELVAAHALESLYEAERLKSIPQSVSSRWWRCAPHGFSDPEEQTKVYVFEYFGGTFVFDLVSGEHKYSSGEAECRGVGGAISTTTFSPGK